ncbi:MAG TPA: hypothetical protein VFN60_03810 [Acidimicrobiales bacterium]|nr:hypothetical protein [Acidimicrobiales bacterium]
MTSAARWQAASTPSSRVRTDAGSSTSPKRTSTASSTSLSRSSSHPADERALYRARARTRCPVPTRVSTSCEPMNPPPP